MIGLRDRYTTRARGEAWLLIGDALAAASAILYISGVFGTSILATDPILIGLWAILPRGLGRILDPLLRQPRGLPRNVVIAATVAATFVSLVSIGLTLVEESASVGVSLYARPWLVLMIFIAWGSGFLLFLPRVYLLHDLFLSGLVALGLAIGREGAEFAVPLFFLGLALSGAVRHQLLDVFVEVRRPRINVVNARRLALALGILITIGFVGGKYGASHLFPHVGMTERKPEAPVWLTGGLANRSEGSRASRSPTEPGAPGDGPRVYNVAGAPPAATTDRIGFNRKVQLGTLSRPQSDPRIVFVAREIGRSGRRISRPSLRPDVLWRGLTLSTFDPLGEAWGEEEMVPGSYSWPDGPLAWDEDLRLEGESIMIDFAVITPTMPTLPAPYFPAWLDPPSGVSPGYELNRAGDIFPIDGIPELARYSAWVVPRSTRRPPWPRDAVRGIHRDPQYSVIPRADDLGFDVVEYVEPIFRGTWSIQQRIERLAQHFRRDFAYDLEAYWVPVTGRLREFCLREKVGNCEYFATAAAVLLRASGVSTRVVAGFLGYEWDPDQNHYLVRNGSAHLWTEVYFPDHGWFPIDATTWVPKFDPEDRPANPGEAIAQGAPTTGSGGDNPEVSPPTVGDAAEESTPSSDQNAPDSSEESEVAELPADPFADSPSAAREAVRREADYSWIQAPTAARPDDPLGLLDGDETSAIEDGELASRRPGETVSAYRTRLKQQARRTLARWSLLVIGCGVLFLVAMQFVRPPRSEEEELAEEEEEAGHHEGGIPDPLAGLPSIPASFVATNVNERVVFAYHRLQKNLAERRRHRRPPETPVEHGGRAARRFPAVESDFERLCTIVYAALYSKNEVSEESAIEAERLCERLRSEMK